MSSIRLLLVDDHEMIRAGVRRLIEECRDWVVCGEASTGREAIALAEQLRPQVVVLDMMLPDLNGVATTRRIRALCPSVEVVLFTASRSESLIRAAFEAGARSYIFKSELAVHLLAAVEAVSRSKAYLTEDVSNVLFSRWFERKGKAGECATTVLSDREMDTLQLVADGKSNKEVSAALGVSIKTVEKHRAAVMRKLRLQSIGELVRYAIRNNIIEA